MLRRPKFVMVTEWCAGGTLASLVQRQYPSPAAARGRVRGAEYFEGDSLLLHVARCVVRPARPRTSGDRHARRTIRD